ncbi:MAG: alpha/beta hydrolase [Desulfobacteraceae bacterium]|jgi:pimeloyl-ACP methyl ester carboxylesterase|nr:alpha/beta hydrolase [Desulfobacteraceae bacterium]
MSDPVMKRAEGDGIQIQLAIWEGEGQPILCVHGLTANCRCWDVIASSLAPENKIVAMDLRGRGLSDKPSAGYSMQHHMRDIVSLLDDLKQERIVLMGHSLGAFISLAFAANYPERTEKIILMDGGGQLTQGQWDKVTVAIKPSLDRLGRVFPSFDAYVALMKLAPFLQPWSQALEDYFQYESEAVEGGVRSRINPANIQEEVQNIQQEVPSEYFPKVTCPVLILRATEGILSNDDLVLPESAVDRMVSEIPEALRVDIEGTNHFSILFQPNEMRHQAIREFLGKYGN